MGVTPPLHISSSSSSIYFPVPSTGPESSLAGDQFLFPQPDRSRSSSPYESHITPGFSPHLTSPETSSQQPGPWSQNMWPPQEWNTNLSHFNPPQAQAPYAVYSGRPSYAQTYQYNSQSSSPPPPPPPLQTRPLAVSHPPPSPHGPHYGDPYAFQSSGEGRYLPEVQSPHQFGTRPASGASFAGTDLNTSSSEQI